VRHVGAGGQIRQKNSGNGGGARACWRREPVVTPDGKKLLSPVGNRVSVFDLVEHRDVLAGLLSGREGVVVTIGEEHERRSSHRTVRS